MTFFGSDLNDLIGSGRILIRNTDYLLLSLTWDPQKGRTQSRVDAEPPKHSPPTSKSEMTGSGYYYTVLLHHSRNFLRGVI